MRSDHGSNADDDLEKQPANLGRNTSAYGSLRDFVCCISATKYVSRNGKNMDENDKRVDRQECSVYSASIQKT